MLEFAMVLGYASTASVSIPLVLMLVHRKRIKYKYFMWLCLLMFCSLLTDITSVIVIKTHLLQTTTYLLNAYHLIQFTLLLLTYRELYLKERKLLVAVLCLVYLAFEIVNSLYFQKLSDHQTWTKALSGLIFIGLSVGYFARMFKGSPMVDITKSAPGWINIAVFVYFAFSLYLFIMAEYVFSKESIETAVTFWGFHNFNNILKNCLFATAVYWGGQERSDK